MKYFLFFLPILSFCLDQNLDNYILEKLNACDNKVYFEQGSQEKKSGSFEDKLICKQALYVEVRKKVEKSLNQKLNISSLSRENLEHYNRIFTEYNRHILQKTK